MQTCISVSFNKNKLYLVKELSYDTQTHLGIIKEFSEYYLCNRVPDTYFGTHNIGSPRVLIHPIQFFLGTIRIGSLSPNLSS